MEFIKDKKILVMNLIDLEHCGFDYEEFLGNLFLTGIDDKEAEHPVMLMVNFSVSHGTVNQTSEHDIKRINARFDEYVKKVKGD